MSPNRAPVRPPVPAPALEAALGEALRADLCGPAARSGAHLAGFALRLGGEAAGPVAPVVPVAVARAHEWTLAQTLAEVRRRAARLTLASRGVRLAHAHRMPDLAAAVQRHEPALTFWLGVCRVPPPFDATGWDEATRLHAAWLATAAPPVLGRVDVRPGHTVVDGQAFRGGIAARLAAGPEHPGADGLRADLGGLFARFGPTALPAAAPARRRMAA